MDNAIFRKMSYGVYLLTTMDGERPTGCTVNSVMQITSEPATVAVSVNHNNFTNECIDRSGLFAFHILSEQSDPALIGTFGFQSGRDADKFEGLSWEKKEGVPVLTGGVNGYVVCRVVNRMETSTHTVFLGEVIDGAVLDASAPQMTYAYYHQVIRGTSPKNAPTYLPEESEKKTAEKKAAEKEASEEKPAKELSAEQEAAEKKVVYVCQVCGYVYEGDPLPEGFICPICKQGADKFKREER